MVDNNNDNELSIFTDAVTNVLTSQTDVSEMVDNDKDRLLKSIVR